MFFPAFLAYRVVSVFGMTNKTPIDFNFQFSSADLKAGLLVSLLSVWVLVGVFYYLNRYTKRRYFSIWTVAWLFYALWLTLNWGKISTPDQGWKGLKGLPILQQWCLSVSATFLLWGSLKFLGKRVRQFLLALFLGFLLVWSFCVSVDATSIATNEDRPLDLLQLPIFTLIGLASLFTAIGFYQYRRKREYLAAGLLSLGFSLWGLYLIAFTFLQVSDDLVSTGFFIAAVLQLFIAVSMIILVLEQVRFAQGRRAMREIRQQVREKNVLQTKVISTEERYRRLFEHATEPIVVASAQTLQFIELNQAAERLLGINNEEAVRLSLTSFCRLENQTNGSPKTGQEWFQIICDQQPLQLVRKDGTIVPSEAEGAPIDYDGQPCFQFFFREVTDKSRLEKQLRQAEKLSSIGQMISGVAHELQNPVTGIKTFLDLALAGNNLAPQTRSDIERAAQECGRVSRLARNFLSIAREHSETRQMVDINELVRNILELRKFDLSVGRVEAIVELDSNLPQAYVKPDQIQQVFLNLINNSLHALREMDRAGRLKIKTRREGTAIQLLIEDDGPGVPDHLVSKIFAPFFTTKPVGVGTGLGLSICHSILCEHQGKIFYQKSSLGGAGFVVEFPIAPAEALAAIRPELSAA